MLIFEPTADPHGCIRMLEALQEPSIATRPCGTRPATLPRSIAPIPSPIPSHGYRLDYVGQVWLARLTKARIVAWHQKLAETPARLRTRAGEAQKPRRRRCGVPKRPTPELTPEQIRAIETGEELSPEEIRQFAEMLDLGAVVEDLLRLKRHLAQAGDFTGANSRNAALASLLSVIKFLNRQLHISPPALIALQLALSDLDDGKVHPLLKPADATGQRLGASRKEQRHRSKVSTETRLLWGCAASAMDCLMQSGFKSDEAATIVGRKLSRLKIEFGDSRGASIGQSIKNWRSRAMRGDPESDLDANVYYELRRMFTHSTNAALDRKNLVKVLEESLRKLGVIA